MVGERGKDGKPGISDGSSGGHATHGRNGTRGTDGNPGQHGANMYINLSGDMSQLRVEGNVRGTFQMGPIMDVLLIDGIKNYVFLN